VINAASGEIDSAAVQDQRLRTKQCGREAYMTRKRLEDPANLGAPQPSSRSPRVSRVLDSQWRRLGRESGRMGCWLRRRRWADRIGSRAGQVATQHL